MKRKIDILLILAIAAFLAALLLLGGCNPLKAVLNDQRKTEQVVYDWRKRNPVDTTHIRYIPGTVKFITRDTVIYDSVRVPYPVNHRYTERRYIDRVTVDTVKITTRDRAYEQVLENKLDDVLASVDIMKRNHEQEAKKLKSKLGQWREWALFAWLLLLILLLLWLNKRFHIFRKIINLFSPVKIPT